MVLFQTFISTRENGKTLKSTWAESIANGLPGDDSGDSGSSRLTFAELELKQEILR